ncbi:spidroin-1-like [Iris pallida]|uniref:Spidroin-1-like n=1 Tax=Iris pallida TaxID=29817 RepID=A0AAX6IH28_IRIPA|nr:spidroin-1-like [Iris pallida]
MRAASTGRCGGGHGRGRPARTWQLSRGRRRSTTHEGLVPRLTPSRGVARALHRVRRGGTEHWRRAEARAQLRPPAGGSRDEGDLTAGVA